MRVQVVSFHCVLKNNLGQLISSSFNQDVVTVCPPNQPDQALAGFIAGMKGMKTGQKKKIFVEAAKAYGFYKPSLVMEVARSRLPNGRRLKVGSLIKAALNDDEPTRDYRVISASSSTLTLDGNHPLAGQDLVFDVEVTDSHYESSNEAFDQWVN